GQIPADRVHPAVDNTNVHGGALAQLVWFYRKVVRHPRAAHAPTPIEMCFVSRNASNPSLPSSRPQPLCLIPPNGALLVLRTPSLIRMVPASSRSTKRNTRSRLVVNAYALKP